MYFRSLVSGILLFFMTSLPSAAQERPEPREPAWIPSLAFRFDTFDYNTDNSVVNRLNPPAQEGTADKIDRELVFMGEAELLGPVLFKNFFGRPRIFVGGGMQFDPFSSDDIFRFGNMQANTEQAIGRFTTLLIGDITRGRCLTFTPPTCATAEPGDFEGQGSEIEAEFRPSWFAELGVAFGFPFANSMLLQVKPSIAYNADRIDLNGSIKTVTENPPDTWFNPNVPEYTVNRGSASQSITQHSLGPGIEIALAVFRESRPIRASLYADARFLWLLGDRTTTFSDSIATYEVTRERFGVRAGAGVRLSWMGLGGRR
jgi:hypothetical protein